MANETSHRQIIYEKIQYYITIIKYLKLFPTYKNMNQFQDIRNHS